MPNDTRYLRKKSDDRAVIPPSGLWLWTEYLEMRGDMVEVWGPRPEALGAGIRVAQEAPIEDIDLAPGLISITDREGDPSIAPGEGVDPPSSDDDVLTIDPARIQAIVAAINELDPKKDYTKKTPYRDPMPKIEAIERITGFRLEKGEREVALEAMKPAQVV